VGGEERGRTGRERGGGGGGVERGERERESERREKGKKGGAEQRLIFRCFPLFASLSLSLAPFPLTTARISP